MNRFLITVFIVSCLSTYDRLSAQVVRTLGGASSVASAELAAVSTVLPITIAATQILVDGVFVNGEGPFRFLLDTGGMGGGRIDATLVEKLHLEKKGEVQAGDGTNRQSVAMPVFELESIRIGELTWKGVTVLSRDYNAGGGS